MYLLLALPLLALSNPIPVSQQNQPETLHAAYSQFYAALTTAASTQYTSTMNSLTPGQQIAAFVGASATLSLILVTLAYVLIKGRKHSAIQKARIQLEGITEVKRQHSLATSTLTHTEQANVISPKPSIGLKINNSPIFYRNPLMPGSALSSAHLSPSETMDMKMHSFQRMSSAVKMSEHLSEGFYMDKFEMIELGDSPKGAGVTESLDRLEAEYAQMEIEKDKKREFMVVGKSLFGTSTTAEVLQSREKEDDVFQSATSFNQEESQADIGSMPVESKK